MLKNNLVLSSRSDYLSSEHNNIFFNDKIFYETDEKLTKKIKYTIPKDTLNEREERIRSFQYCEEIYNSIIKDLTINLNQINKVEWGVQSWSIILGGWLFEILPEGGVDEIYFSIENLYFSEILFAKTKISPRK